MRDWRADALAVSDRDGITQLHVPRPAARADEWDRLAWAIVDTAAEIAEDDNVRRGVFITCDGPSFLVGPRGASWSMVDSTWQHAVEAVARIDCPVVAVIGADAIGPGWQLALACDLRIASNGVRVGLPENVSDVEPVMSVERAYGLGRVTELVPPDRLSDATEKLAKTLRRNAPIAAAYAKEAVRRAGDLTLADGMQLEEDLNVLLQTTSDRAEGIAAFLARRTPEFRGR